MTKAPPCLLFPRSQGPCVCFCLCLSLEVSNQFDVIKANVSPRCALSHYGLQRKHAPELKYFIFLKLTMFPEHVPLLISHIPCKCAHLSLHHAVSLKCIRAFPLTGDLCASPWGGEGQRVGIWILQCQRFPHPSAYIIVRDTNPCSYDMHQAVNARDETTMMRANKGQRLLL